VDTTYQTLKELGLEVIFTDGFGKQPMVNHWPSAGAVAVKKIKKIIVDKGIEIERRQ